VTARTVRRSFDASPKTLSKSWVDLRRAHHSALAAHDQS
jgi:hypothetical protein